jgi:outer membrane protein OmpA-like peptidoglycan-associated protein
MASRMRHTLGLSLGALVVAPTLAVERAPEIPFVAGMHIVLAVNNHTGQADHERGILQGDYEMVVEVGDVTAESVTHTAHMDGTDAKGVHRRLAIPRVVMTGDLESSGVQVLGFHTDDPPKVSGTTSLGPSRSVVGKLVRSGETAYSFVNFVNQGIVSGTLKASGAPVRFPVLLNGRRVELEAIRATGHMALGGVSRPFETVILDHPRYPLSLRIAYGPRGGALPFEPEFQREIVRIDLPHDAPASTAAATLEETCRLEVPGIYFDFNRATLKPESKRGLEDMAGVLKSLDRRAFVIEGHTDNIGSDRYNEDLSARRADAVRSALVHEHGIASARLSAAGFGERRPIETNDTLSGRARNRRVELACAPPAR